MKKIITILILFISAKCFSQTENNFMQKNTFWDTTYFKNVPYSASAGVVHLGIDTVVSSPTFGKLVRKTAGGVTTMGTFGSTPNSNGASISGSTLTLQPADASNPGGVSTTTQTFAGAKTFSGITQLASGNIIFSPSSNFNTANGIYLAGSADNTQNKVLQNPASVSLTAANNFVNNLITNSNNITEASSGVHNIISQFAIKPLNVVDGTATTNYGATLYIQGSAIGTATITNNYALWIDSSYSRFDGRVLKTQGADVASVSGAITLTDGNSFEITGTNAITLISNIGWQNGSEITLLFTSTASLTDGTANSGTDIGMELNANTNFTGSAGASITLILSEIGGTQRWREKCRSVN